MPERPEAIPGELQFEDLELLSDRQAESLVGGLSFSNSFKLLLRRNVAGFPNTFLVNLPGGGVFNFAPI